MVSEADRTRWARLQEAFEAALDVPAGERAAHLAVADAELRTDVEALLEAHARDGGLDAISSALAPDERGPVPPEPSVPAAFGPWEVIRTVASGGMGSVHLVRRADDRGTWALKVLRADAASDSLRRRFLVERQILERLAHPGIARLVDDGIGPDGLPWLVMEYVDGTPIDAHCDRAGLAVAERLRLFLAVCDAVEHAHRVGVVHRDLKPGNVRWTGGGHPVLLDFGIGFRTDRPPGTRTSELFGTAPYAAPEQWADGSGVGPHTDVYQAGLVLYELLTLQRCFDGATPIETLRAIREARYRRPRELDPGIDEQLERCVLQAIEIDPARRYASARAFREDLERHLRGELPQAARPVARWSWHARAFARRHRSALAIAAAVLVGAAGVWFASRGSPRVSIVWDGRSIRIEAPAAGRIAGFLIGVDAHGEERSRPLDFGRSVVRDVPAGVTTIDLGAGLESFRDVLVSALFAAHGDDEVERRFAAAVAPLEQARREVEQREGQWLPATNLRAQFLAGRGAAASSLPVEALFVPGAWADAGLQGVVVGRPPS